MLLSEVLEDVFGDFIEIQLDKDGFSFLVGDENVGLSCEVWVVQKSLIVDFIKL